MSDGRIDFLYLNEKDMIEAGVLDAGREMDGCMAEAQSVGMGGRGFHFQEKGGGVKASVLFRTELLGSMGQDGEKRAFGKLCTEELLRPPGASRHT